MIVNRNDETCWECEGTLEVVDVDDVSLTVWCTECESSFRIEPDALGDGGITYYVPFQAQKAAEWDAAEELQGGA